MKIMILCGSPRQSSLSRRLSAAAVELVSHRKMETLAFDVGMDPLPLFQGGEESLHPGVKRWKRLADESEGFFIITPEYHNGISGALKNALDFLDRSSFRRKPVAIAAASGGGKGGVNALNNLRLILRGLYAWVLPEQMIVDFESFSENGELLPADFRRLQEVMEELAVWTEWSQQGTVIGKR
ncbi:NADPH-dependent FMN reductase [Paludifilum halophilum]|uniref:NADPH-dependent FMN reductase-like domain-containing protein n=1 Tax=Paludifilum halophilum TaxID=1642702 RepID=A0A235B4I3_9BACL|nr:NADPH-dependent FMN reductase [Paludifilum halophilum]OYD07218.1 hypothetical protein CHM34_12605 [Paludifilum halophilum]